MYIAYVYICITLNKEINMSRIRITGFSSVKQTVSPERFLQIVKEHSNSIKHVHFVPPTIGKRDDFGKLEIEYFNGKR